MSSPVKCSQPSHCRGVTLIELLVGLAVGAIVILAVIAAWGLSVRSAAYALESARLNNDLRSAMQIMVQDLRRADGGVRTTTTPPDVVRFAADGSCVTYFVEGLPRGFRLREGLFEMYFDDASPNPPTCDLGTPEVAKWSALYEGLTAGEFRITDFTASWQAVCYPFDATLDPEFFDSATLGAATYPRCDGMSDATEVLEVTLTLSGEIGTASGTKAMTVSDTVTVRNNDVLNLGTGP